jgi:hypothetical protein
MPRLPFVGREARTSNDREQIWMHGLRSGNLDESFHINGNGHRVIADLIARSRLYL